MSFRLDWFGDRAKQAIIDAADSRLRAAGVAGVDTARHLVPIDTGKLHDSIGMTYDQSNSLVTIYADMPYAEHVEFGTSRQRAQPYIRPAMMEAAEVLKGKGSVVGQLGGPEGVFVPE